MKNIECTHGPRPIPSWLTLSGAAALCAGLLVLPQPAGAQVDVVMQHNDLNRTGANLNETTLTPSNVNTNQFGKLFSHSVDGKVYAQPLYVAGLNFGGTIHNAIYVCTDDNDLYALDADDGSQLWHDNFGSPVPNSDVGGCGDMSPQIGITGTPVIDTNNGTLYVDSRTLSGSTYAHKLHAISLTNGVEKFGGPVTISASVNGKSFNAHYQHQRPGLLLLNGVIYIAYGSDCDANTYYGWLLGYNETNLSQTVAFNTTPSGSAGAIWSCGNAPAVDSSGNIYVMTANGSFNANNGGSDLNYSECFLKLSTPGLSVSSYFCPSNQAALTSADEDLGSGGPVLLPGTDLLVGVGKEGKVFLCNTGSLGGYSTSKNNVVQEFSAFSENDHVGQNPVYWHGPSDQYLYFSAGGSKTKVYTFNGSTIDTSAVAESSETQGNPGGISISANGTSDGILWVIDDGNNGTLRAYNADASSSFTELWNSQDDSSRDSLGSYVKFVSPTIANGKVYVGAASNLVAYGLLNTQEDFTISTTPSSQTVLAGNGTNYSVTIGSVNGFDGSVSLTAGGLPAGASASFTPSSVTAPGSSTLSVTTSASTPPGTYPLTVTGTSGSLVHSNSVNLAVTGALPSGWTDTDVGAVGIPGSASYSSGTFTVSGSGADITGTNDEFNYVYQSVSGDLTLVAQVETENGTQPYAKAGVMIRESLASDATRATVVITPTNGVAMEVRTSTGGTAIELAGGWIHGVPLPQWVELVRSGSTFTGYYSSDGSTWTEIASTNITMNTNATAGLAVTAHDNTSLNTATIDNVSIASAGASFSLSTSPSSQTVTAGNQTTYTATVTAINGFTGTVSFAVGGLPSGANGSFNPASVSGSGSSTLTVTTTTNTPTGTDTLSVTGASGSLAQTNTVTLTVNAASTNNFTGIFQIQNEASSLVLNNQGSLTNGSAITQWRSETSSNLDWQLFATTNGYYQINSCKSALDAVVQNALTNAGTGIIQWSFGSSGDDQWKPTSNSDGSYTFYNLRSGLVLGDPGSSTNDTTQMDQETPSGGSNQNWKLLLQ